MSTYTLPFSKSQFTRFSGTSCSNNISSSTRVMSLSSKCIVYSPVSVTSSKIMLASTSSCSKYFLTRPRSPLSFGPSIDILGFAMTIAFSSSDSMVIFLEFACSSSTSSSDSIAFFTESFAVTTVMFCTGHLSLNLATSLACALASSMSLMWFMFSSSCTSISVSSYSQSSMCTLSGASVSTPRTRF